MLLLCACSAQSPNAGGEGLLSSFTATDLDGAAVDQSVFAGCKLTMVNVWATYCGPCIAEMPDLAALGKSYASQGFQVIGIVADAANSDGSPNYSMVSAANTVIASTGADYLHLMPSVSLKAALLSGVSAVPTTVFVDENGAQVGRTYVGSRSSEQWAAIIESLLAK